MASPALQVLEAEIAALDALREEAGTIAEAAEAIAKAPCRVIVTGMGKCSHIGRKIAATLQSTGQPAAFLHPAEALHGDMGMIADGDMVLALSNSGQTTEVMAVVQFALAKGCDVIAITSKPFSPLFMLADSCGLTIIIPDGPEGCPIGRAPMASTMSMLAVGDMLAAELMALRGFGDEEFLQLHHGGYLGSLIAAGR